MPSWHESSTRLLHRSYFIDVLLAFRGVRLRGAFIFMFVHHWNFSKATFVNIVDLKSHRIALLGMDHYFLSEGSTDLSSRDKPDRFLSDVDPNCYQISVIVNSLFGEFGYWCIFSSGWVFSTYHLLLMSWIRPTHLVGHWWTLDYGPWSAGRKSTNVNECNVVVKDLGYAPVAQWKRPSFLVGYYPKSDIESCLETKNAERQI